ncbi:unnamed protein product [Amoebophrya sp. A120]|nr:unnamed protein product [Amoebophrya sp. A120]|eukprot:GSA120T00003885001.1
MRTEQARMRMRWTTGGVAPRHLFLALLHFSSTALQRVHAVLRTGSQPCPPGYTRDARSCDGVCADCDCLPGFKCCCRVPPGYYSLGDRALRCPGGTYQDEFAQSYCKACPSTAGIVYNPAATRVPATSTIIPSTESVCALAACTSANVATDCQTSAQVVTAMSAPVVQTDWCVQYLQLPNVRTTLRQQCVFSVETSSAYWRRNSGGLLLFVAIYSLRWLMHD